MPPTGTGPQVGSWDGFVRCQVQWTPTDWSWSPELCRVQLLLLVSNMETRWEKHVLNAIASVWHRIVPVCNKWCVNMLWIKVYNRAHLIYLFCFLDTANKPTGKCSFDYPELMKRAGWGGRLRSLCKGWLGRWCSWGACDDPRSGCPELVPSITEQEQQNLPPCCLPKAVHPTGIQCRALLPAPRSKAGARWPA